MSLDHLEHVARMAGYAAVPEEDEAVAEAARERRTTLGERLRSPDAPAPRRTAPASTAVTVPVTAAVQTYVTGALRTAQGLIGTRNATA
jgi:hypothetical protein